MDTAESSDKQRLRVIVRAEPAGPWFMEIPHPVYGALCLSLSGPLDPGAMEMSPTQRSQAQAELERCVNQGTLERDGLVALIAQFPLFAPAYRALSERCQRVGDAKGAEFYLKQCIALEPHPNHLALLGKQLGQAGRLEDSRVVLEHLYAGKEQIQDQASALVVALDLLVTLTRLQDGAAMVDLAEDAIAHFGSTATLEYQCLLGMMLSGRSDEAKRRWSRVFPTLNPVDSLHGKFVEMGQILGISLSDRLAGHHASSSDATVTQAPSTAFQHEYTHVFIEPGPWVVEETEHCRLSVTDGHYRVEGLTEDMYTSFVPMGVVDPRQRYGFEAEMRGRQGDVAYGLLVGSASGSDGLLFLVRPARRSWRVIERNNGVVQVLDSAQTCPHFASDVDILRLEHLDARQRFFINGRCVSQIGARAFRGDKHGVFVEGKGSFLVRYHKVHWGTADRL